MKMSEQNRHWACTLAGLGVTALLLSGASCSSKLELSPPLLVKALADRGWTYSDPPRGILSAGSIVTVTKEHGIKYRSDLSTCISDTTITKPKVGAVAISGTLSGSTSFDISVLASYETISLGPDFNKLKNFSITMKSATEEALDTIAIRNWIESHRGQFSSACADALIGKPGEAVDGTGGFFVLTDVLRVTGYKYTFHDDAGVKVNLSTAPLGKYFTIGGNTNFKTNSDGDLETEQGDLYIAFQQDVSTNVGAAGLAPSLSAVDIMKSRNLHTDLSVR